ncbi:hypothetical protein STRTUCAR8_06082 [Streptomyces turgidiscabies Car8]|uniref:Uncharacterized protein n=1 Tax=Streptomyces turgidiscabies (strain Car8) TaxID=698760 RepID=L7EXP6_STRT8|nr:hypothetical protein STRTUCAR8_06082 [Streptomyces turgidiscabies Car8]
MPTGARELRDQPPPDLRIPTHSPTPNLTPRTRGAPRTVRI